MGAKNVITVYQNWANLPHREMRALAFMAVNGMDDAEPPVYFGGWEALAVALGADPFGNTESARKTATRAISGLLKAGAIVSTGRAGAGVRAEYAIILTPGELYTPCGKGREATWGKVEQLEKPTPISGTATGRLNGTATGHKWDSYGPLVGQLGGPLKTTKTTKNNRGEQHQVLTQAHEQNPETVDNPASVDTNEDTERHRQLKALQKILRAGAA